MTKYTIQMNYIASMVVEVEVEGHGPELEGIAMDKAREIAEDADMREFTINSEVESKILSIN